MRAALLLLLALICAGCSTTPVVQTRLIRIAPQLPAPCPMPAATNPAWADTGETINDLRAELKACATKLESVRADVNRQVERP